MCIHVFNTSITFSLLVMLKNKYARQFSCIFSNNIHIQFRKLRTYTHVHMRAHTQGHTSKYMHTHKPQSHTEDTNTITHTRRHKKTQEDKFTQKATSTSPHAWQNTLSLPLMQFPQLITRAYTQGHTIKCITHTHTKAQSHTKT